MTNSCRHYQLLFLDTLTQNAYLLHFIIIMSGVLGGDCLAPLHTGLECSRQTCKQCLFGIKSTKLRRIAYTFTLITQSSASNAPQITKGTDGWNV